MNIHEYQAKALLAKFAVPLLKGGVAYTKDEAMDVARKLGSPVTVVKAQIHAGGRGKGKFKDDPNGKGGVRIAKSVEEVGASTRPPCWAMSWSPSRPARPARPSSASISRKAATSNASSTSRMLVDRALGRVAIVASTEGGMDIETVAHDHARQDRQAGRSTRPSASRPIEGRKIAFALGLTGKQVDSLRRRCWAASTRPSPSSTAR